MDALDDDREETLLFVSASSCGTLAGLLHGFTLLDRPDVRLFGVSADAPAEDLRAITLALAAEGAALLETSPALHRISLETKDDQVGEGYGIPTSASTEALRRFARLEGVVLDPTYTAKAAAGMIAYLAGPGVTPQQRVVFVVDLLPVGTVPGRGLIDFYPLEAEAAIERILAMEWDVLIPGHPGAGGRLVGTKQDARDQLTFLRDVSAAVKAEAQQGRCWEPVESTLQIPKYASWPGYEANLAFALRRYCALWGRGT